jgi:septum formation protein
VTWQAEAPALVLASGSAARGALLDSAGLRFEVRIPAIDEAAVKRAAGADGLAADECAMLLADLKAARVSRADAQALVIGADQLLVCEGRWFDKPATLDDARAHLLALRGREHELVTAVTCMRDARTLWHHVARPRLRMRAFSDAFLGAYLEREGPLLTDSVGAYRLEGPGVHLFDRIDGEYAAILGLPLLSLLGFLRQHGVLPS